jgi:8-oxo-dGTP pyrophosphatase MutT (NUDIX family)
VARPRSPRETDIAEAHARPVIRVVAALILDEFGRLLLVRKKNTTFFMQAGGKLQPGETPREALGRELEEELGLHLDLADFEYLGRFATLAANEHGHDLDAELFAVAAGELAVAAAEIEEIAWIDADNRMGLPLAPLTVDYVLPLVRARLAWPE